MKIATWNVNSVRARLNRLVEYLKVQQPDVLCLQELKCIDAQFPKLEMESLGYHTQTFGQKAYNGVAILTKTPATEVKRDRALGDEQARVISAIVQGVVIVCVYAPNGQSVDAPAYQYKLRWYAHLSQWLQQWTGNPLLVCGDFNVAPEAIDTWNPALWEGRILCTSRERQALRALMECNHLVDLFRVKHPEENNRFSWWDYRSGAFHKNQGLRIDLLLSTNTLMNRCTEIDIHRATRKGKQPSDHTPVWAILS